MQLMSAGAETKYLQVPRHPEHMHLTQVWGVREDFLKRSLSHKDVMTSRMEIKEGRGKGWGEETKEHSGQKEHHRHGPKVRKGREQRRNAWLEYTASGEKKENGAGEGSKHWVLKALLDVKIYPENNGGLWKSFKEGVI